MKASIAQRLSRRTARHDSAIRLNGGPGAS